MKKLISAASLAILLGSGQVQAANELELSGTNTGNPSEIISGVSSFLMDRAKENYKYMFHQKLVNNGPFQCYFPSTYEYAQDQFLFDLLMQSGPEAWKETIEKDLSRMGVYMLYSMASRLDFDALNENGMQVYLDIIRQYRINIGGETYPLDSLPFTARATMPDLMNRVNAFYEPYSKWQASLKDIETVVKSGGNQYSSLAFSESDLMPSSCFTVADDGYEQFRMAAAQLEDSLSKILVALKEAKELFKRSDIEFVPLQGSDQDVPSLDSLSSTFRSVSFVQQVKEIKEVASDAHKTLLMKVYKITQLMESAQTLSMDNTSSFDAGEYQRFVRIVSSLASIAEAQSADQVKAILNSLTLPPVSYGIKRREYTHSATIGSYLGLAATRSSDAGGKGALFAPIGVELSWTGGSQSPYSLMLAPFDFGQAVNAELYDEEKETKFSDVLAPGLYASYGFSDVPLAVGLGVQRGKSLEEGNDSKETRVMLFFGFDMPLFNLMD